ncbi:chromosome segregation and condensation protein, ScpB [mine drainage metagenome]|uniref:Chromosome segregation and condensation protein, ScpB n=1 Tax=mine drainage metagenome TaxID=410659 RepID=T1BE45_9ZZZZ
MPTKITPEVLRVEALLFAAGKPLGVKEITQALGVDDYRPIQAAVRILQENYAHRQSALEVRRVGDRYALQLREEWVSTVHSVTPVEMAPRTLRTLTLIAYHQPIFQSALVRMVGDSAYEEVQRLRGMNLIRTEPSGATLELTTTRRFAEYFGIASTKPEDIRRFLEQKLGVTSAPSEPSPAEATPPPAPVPVPAADATAADPPGP